jgi:DNA polymerase III alpha subunit
LVLLAETMEGYKNMMKLASVAYLDGFYYRPRIDRNLMRQHGKGLIALAGPRSDIGKFLTESNMDKAKERTKEYLEIFGKDNFFFELVHQPDSPSQKEIDDSFIAIGKELGVGVVASRNVYYLKPEQAEARTLLLCIKDNRTIEDRERSVTPDVDLSMSSPEEIEAAFKDIPEAIENNEKIAARCEVKLELGKWNFPIYEIPDGLTAIAYLRKISFERLPVLVKHELTQVEIDRLNYEIDIVEKKGYATYFLVVADYGSWARGQGIVLTTRGSAAGSLMAYAIGIVTVNPLEYNLPFERFLNPLRPSAPDIDMDFADHRRGEVLEYVKGKYGADRVAQICTFGTMAARASMRDVGRALGYPVAFCDQIAKIIPFGQQGFAMTIDRALAETPDFKRRYDTEPEVKRMVDLAKQIEGNARHCSVHAAGVVISDKPLVEYTPLQRESGGEAIITQYEMHAVEDAGVLKMDFLGIRNLSILEYAIDLAKRTKGAIIDLVHMDLKDKKTFEMLAAGKTMGLFQLNGEGMTKYLMQLKPTMIEDIMAMVALYRPGPIDIIPDFIKRKHNPKLITYLDPRMKDYLQMSYGMLVYQDDVLLTAINLAGYDWLEADKFRKAMGKKIPEEMAKQEIKFKEGVIAHGMIKAKADELWELIKPFAAYGFNKCLSGDTRVMDPADGSCTTLEGLYQRGGEGRVLALQCDMKFRPEKRFRVVTNGVKAVFTLRTSSGKSIRATGNHPFMTERGWVQLDHLACGQRVAVAETVHVAAENKGITSIPDNRENGGSFLSAAKQSIGLKQEERQLGWEQILSIIPSGEEMTYDLEVPGSHNFVANDFVVHNSHAASYGIVAYQTAYMKANFPAEYMTALMTAESGDLDTVALAVKECDSMGIAVLPPDVNSSEAGFTYINDQQIRFGLNTIKGLGVDTVLAIIDERKANGPFKELSDFAGRISGKAFNKKSLEALAKSGALDGLGERNQIVENIDVLTTYNKNMIKERENGQSSLFAFVVPEGAQLVPMLGLRNVPEATRKQRLTWEKDLLGMYVSAHPFEDTAKEFGDLLTPISKALTFQDRAPIRVGGTVTSVKQIITKKSGEPMLFATITDLSGQAECLVFPSVFKENGAAWVEGANLAVTGKLSRKDDEPKFLADRGWPLNEETIPIYKAHFRGEAVSSEMMLAMNRPKSRATQGEVRVSLPSKMPPSAIAALKTVLAKFPGHALVALDVRSEGGFQRVETSFLIDPSVDAVAAIEKHVGMGNVKVYQAL